MRALFNNYTLWFGTEFVNLYKDDNEKGSDDNEKGGMGTLQR